MPILSQFRSSPGPIRGKKTCLPVRRVSVARKPRCLKTVLMAQRLRATLAGEMAWSYSFFIFTPRTTRMVSGISSEKPLARASDDEQTGMLRHGCFAGRPAQRSCR